MMRYVLYVVSVPFNINVQMILLGVVLWDINLQIGEQMLLVIVRPPAVLRREQCSTFGDRFHLAASQ